MNKYKQRTENIYQKNSVVPFPLSRTKIELYLDCPRCFYLDRKLGLGKPSSPGFSLNSAVDALLKNEFDLLRKSGERHELMVKYGIDAIPFSHPDMDKWRENFVGARVIYKPTNFEITGAIDDIWINKEKELLIVDYKSTSTIKEISLEDEFKQGYKKQMEVYQWIFRQLGFTVNETGYFVFANAKKDRKKFDGRLEFELSIVSYKGDTSWIEPTLLEMKKCLDQDTLPAPNPDCEFCMYRKLIKENTKGVE